jgi:hypothetical protein
VPSSAETSAAVAGAATWNARVALIRRIPEDYGTAQQAAVYAAVAGKVYVPALQPDFAYVHWRDDYELPPLAEAYERAHNATAGFTQVSVDDLERVISAHPAALRVFRLLLGFTIPEFTETCGLVAAKFALPAVSKSTVSTIEERGRIAANAARTCARVIHLVMERDASLFPPTPEGTTLRRKIEKPDTADGWETVRRFSANGVPLAVFLHQRAYGGAFRQLLDATSSDRGSLIEEPVEKLLRDARIPYIRTGAHDQAAIATRFGLTVKPAPDFVIYAEPDNLRAILECKGASDGGTARDKAARFRALRAETQRLGGIPLFAVLAGIGWRRVHDALGPVVRDTDGRTFTLATLPEMLDTEPLPELRGRVAAG